VCLNCILSSIGAVFLLALFTRFFFFISRHFTGPKVSIAKLCGTKSVKDSWAVVTGSSDGIGRGYALELAKRGLNIVLISRTQEKLEQVAQEIRNNYKVETRVLAVDFISADDSTYKRIADALSDIPVAVLVNNVGINYEHPQRYLEAPEKLDDSIIHVNITATNKLTRIVLPQMLDRKAGAIINLSSMAGRVPTPMLTVYSATKAYIDFFSKGLAQEYSKFGIIVQSVTPGMVVSNMSKMKRTSLMVSSPAHIAKRSIDRLGCEFELSPYYIHAIIIYLLNVLPLSFVEKKLLSMNEGIQRRALRKK
jgi:17beta-estradiol 17-dehydrogenase / very-long-chain 3-oxoacyl-CoA reductase